MGNAGSTAGQEAALLQFAEAVGTLKTAAAKVVQQQARTNSPDSACLDLSLASPGSSSQLRQAVEVLVGNHLDHLPVGQNHPSSSSSTSSTSPSGNKPTGTSATSSSTSSKTIPRAAIALEDLVEMLPATNDEWLFTRVKGAEGFALPLDGIKKGKNSPKAEDDTTTSGRAEIKNYGNEKNAPTTTLIQLLLQKLIDVLEEEAFDSPVDDILAGVEDDTSPKDDDTSRLIQLQNSHLKKLHAIRMLTRLLPIFLGTTTEVAGILSSEDGTNNYDQGATSSSSLLFPGAGGAEDEANFLADQSTALQFSFNLLEAIQLMLFEKNSSGTSTSKTNSKSRTDPAHVDPRLLWRCGVGVALEYEMMMRQSPASGSSSGGFNNSAGSGAGTTATAIGGSENRSTSQYNQTSTRTTDPFYSELQVREKEQELRNELLLLLLVALSGALFKTAGELAGRQEEIVSEDELSLSNENTTPAQIANAMLSGTSSTSRARQRSMSRDEGEIMGANDLSTLSAVVDEKLWLQVFVTGYFAHTANLFFSLMSTVFSPPRLPISTSRFSFLGGLFFGNSTKSATTSERMEFQEQNTVELSIMLLSILLDFEAGAGATTSFPFNNQSPTYNQRRYQKRNLVQARDEAAFEREQELLQYRQQEHADVELQQHKLSKNISDQNLSDGGGTVSSADQHVSVSSSDHDPMSSSGGGIGIAGGGPGEAPAIGHPPAPATSNRSSRRSSKSRTQDVNSTSSQLDHGDGTEQVESNAFRCLLQSIEKDSELDLILDGFLRQMNVADVIIYGYNANTYSTATSKALQNREERKDLTDTNLILILLWQCLHHNPLLLQRLGTANAGIHTPGQPSRGLVFSLFLLKQLARMHAQNLDAMQVVHNTSSSSSTSEQQQSRAGGAAAGVVPSQQTMTSRTAELHLCSFLLLLLSGERNIAVSLNTSINTNGNKWWAVEVLNSFSKNLHSTGSGVAKAAARTATAGPRSTEMEQAIQQISKHLLAESKPATFADFFVLVLLKLISDSLLKDEPLVDLLLTILCNISPYLKQLAVTTCLKLTSFFERICKKNYLLKNSTNYRNLFLLIEFFTNIIQYQAEGNQVLLYSLVRVKSVFEKLEEMELDEEIAEREVERMRNDRDQGQIAGSQLSDSTTTSKQSSKGKNTTTAAAAAATGTATSGKDKDPNELQVNKQRSHSSDTTTSTSRYEQQLLNKKLWFHSWHDQKLPQVLSTVKHLIYKLEPEIIEQFYNTAREGPAGNYASGDTAPPDMDTIIEYMRTNTTTVGLLPQPHAIVVRTYIPNLYTTIWFTHFLYGAAFAKITTALAPLSSSASGGVSAAGNAGESLSLAGLYDCKKIKLVNVVMA
ncbi:unnamed protein product [Amoebophrya sp. A120]|nr:unnamed protein product [Amoebophrya sp. A120]|eukprot:GSA120T00013631001.1